MMIDVNCFAGHWPSRRLDGDLPAVRDSLRGLGVDLMYVSPLESAWSRNPHQPNGALYESVAAFEDVRPVPVLDPTIATWQSELTRAAERPDVDLIRLLPAYSPYSLSDADELLAAAAAAGLVVLCQTRMEDPRRQHPLAQVPDAPIADVVAAAGRHPDLTLIVGGASAAQARSLSNPLRDLPNLYADTSQIDGVDSIRGLVEEGLAERLLFGSHAPLFTPYAAVARVVADIDDSAAAAIMGSNALRLLN
jgi:uncharacterized protein